MVPGRSALRALLAICLLVPAGGLASAYLTAPANGELQANTTANANRTAETDPEPSADTEELTVVTTGSNRPAAEASNDSRATAELLAYDHNGSIQYYNDSHDRYWDVDPVGNNGTGETRTVEYVAFDRLNASACGLAPGDTNDGNEGGESDPSGEETCSRNVIERVNLTTGAVTSIHEESAPQGELAPWNDADRINDTHYVVADRSENRVFVLDTRTGQPVWEWYASAVFPFESGGYYLDDWTHLNDVEVLSDGRIMASLRNHDQVIVLDPDRPTDRALLAGWTLGADGNHSTLYEPYNPDYIPEAAGGPAVLVADSANNRVVEYARRNDSWNRSWTWTDDTLQWPRDADRLPNGHTLVVDSNGDRVLELDRTGKRVWNVSVGLPYDAERLGTGPESTSGPSATRLEEMNPDSEAGTDRAARNESDPAAGPDGNSLSGAVKRAVPAPTLRAVLYLSPAWFGIPELLALFVIVLVVPIWTLFELRWRSAGAALRRWAEGER